MPDELSIITEVLNKYDLSIRDNQLKILIFGPGEFNLKSFPKLCYQKRIQIRDLLNTNGHDALLPEDVFAMASSIGSEPKNKTLFEKLLVDQHCDLAIFIYVHDCKGLDHELSAFTMIPDIAVKTKCFYETGHRFYWTDEDKLDLIERQGGQLEGFDEKDITECHLSRKVLELAENLRRIALYLPYIKY